MENYIEKLQKILTATGWSQEFLASRVGVSFVSLNSWLNGKSSPRQSAKSRIDILAAEILGQDSISTTDLKSLKQKAESKKITAKKLLSSRELLEKITTDFTYHSNGIEGSTMTSADVTAVIYGKKILKNRTATEQREAINHQTALYFLLDELSRTGSDFKITPDLIKATHLRMMNGIISDAGCYRNHGVQGATTPLANFIKIPELITNWCNSVNEETSDKISLLARSHADFEKIHPFSDGNGRTGRLLLFILALKLGLVPPILLKEKRLAYYKYLETAQLHDSTDPLEQFIAEAIISTSGQID